MLKLYRQLKAQGILSINRRNSDYVLRYNPRKLFPLVDDKLKTKNLALTAGIAVPLLYSTIVSEQQIKNFPAMIKPYKDFVIKPVHGMGGEGILVISNCINGFYRQANGKLLTQEELDHHLSGILSGIYSLGGAADLAMIEQRIVADPIFADLSFAGVPDLRIIILLGYPVMAMLRLPTSLSRGKANLHQGAIGVGVNLATGKTLGGVFHNKALDFHPDTFVSVSNLLIPYWQQILLIAANCFELTGLGYLGVDLVLDAVRGPLMLELNARPGLNIQIANRAGGLKIYQQIETHVAGLSKPEDAARRVAHVQDIFGYAQQKILQGDA